MSALSRTLSSERLREMLGNNYKRVDLKTVCDQTMQASTHPNLAVWVHESPMWVRLSDDSVRELWQANAKTRSRSFCHFISRDLLQLSSHQYVDIKRSLERVKSEELMGIYQAREDTSDGQYALVLDFPPTSAMNRNLLLGGAALAGALTVGGVVARVAGRKFKPAVGNAQPANTENLQLADLQGQIELKKRELLDLEQSILTTQGQAQFNAGEAKELDETRTQNARLSAELQRLNKVIDEQLNRESSVDAVDLNANLLADNRQLKTDNGRLETEIANVKGFNDRLTRANEQLETDCASVRQENKQLTEDNERLAEENQQLQANKSVYADLPELDLQDVASDKYNAYKRSIDKELAQLVDYGIESIGDVRNVIEHLRGENNKIEKSRQDIVNKLGDVFGVNDFEDLQAAVNREQKNIANVKKQNEDLRQANAAVAAALTTGLYKPEEIEGLLDQDSAQIVKHAMSIASQYPDEMVDFMANNMQAVEPVMKELIRRDGKIFGGSTDQDESIAASSY